MDRASLERLLAAGSLTGIRRVSASIRLCEAYIEEGLLPEAARLALAALKAAPQRDPALRFTCYMLLACCKERQADLEAALNFCLAARITALEAEMHARVFEATARFLEVWRKLGDRAGAVIREIDRTYLPLGLNIFEYLPEGLVRRPQRGGLAPS
jgi:hypothetical protein